ncbi:MAG: DNA translocase FtsK [Candidatus Riflebacteria bacterium]|nr:DNA translocase FtsK [Candidatus Riflebacteria bacterium]
MTKENLIGKIAVALLKEKLNSEDIGTARFLLDCLTPEQTGAIALAVLEDSVLEPLIEIKLPQHFVSHLNLPEHILTNQRATYFRSASCPKSAYLLANVGDDEQQSLKELIPINEYELKNNPLKWTQIASQDLLITSQQVKSWEKALQGLLETHSFSLDRFAEYILETRMAIIDGNEILKALGIALPKILAPKDSMYFSSNLDNKNVNHVSKWKTLFSNVLKKRACYLLKQTPTQQQIHEDTLKNSFDKVRESIPEITHETIANFISAPAGWNSCAENLANCEWENVKYLFDGLKKESFNLGKATLDFYDELEKGLISEEEYKYLEKISNTKSSETNEIDETFFRDHRKELRENSALKAKWDKFIFGTPIENEDFLVGLVLCLESLFDREFRDTQRTLVIRCDYITPKDLKNLNENAGLYFCHRYKGISRYFGSKVKWETGELFNFPDLVQKWRAASKSYVNLSKAKSALQIKFHIALEITQSNQNVISSTRQLIWIFNPDAVGNELFQDWKRLSEHPFTFSNVHRSTISIKGRFQSLNLTDVSTFMPTFGRDRGSFVPPYKKNLDIAHKFEENLKIIQKKELLKQETLEKVSVAFEEFKKSYSDALQVFIKDGFDNVHISQQCKDFGNLLEIICRDTKGDTLRELLLKPLLEIGIVKVEGEIPNVIIPPWHPLRFSGILCKIQQVSNLIKFLLTTEEVYFGDPKLFFKEIQIEMEHPYYPEVVIGWRDSKPELLSLTDSYLDYSLHELPLVQDKEFDYTNENPTKSASIIMDLLKRYLSLFPHEKSNLSVVLFNCDSARLPETIVEKLGEMNEEIEEMRCQVVLRHRDSMKLRDLYEKIIEAEQTDPDSFVSSEISADFMARLRIGIMADQAPPQDPKDGPPADIVFLQDVISRHAKIEWYMEKSEPVEAIDFYPPRWNKKRPAAIDDMKSVVYLCCPVQTKEGWAYITALTSFLKGDWDNSEEMRFLPARQLDFCEPITKSIFNEIHNLGNWVVNYDELLDKRQLMNQGVRVIRYKQSHIQDRNLLISSSASLGLLSSMIISRVTDLNLNVSADEIKKLSNKFIEEANKISGDIVLRAAKRGKNASELMGVVLSSYLIRREYKKTNLWGWFFLDDYAEWFGQKEQKIADVLALTPHIDETGKYRLSIVISEAKYIDFSCFPEKKKESFKQLSDTYLRISDALFGNPKRIDRDLWLSRLSDLFISGIQFPASTDIDIFAWRNAIREGECEISLKGYSHIFISGPTDSPDCSEMIEGSIDNIFQEIFSRSDLREIVLSFLNNKDSMKLRKKVSNKDIWSEEKFQKPADRVLIYKNKSIDFDEEIKQPEQDEKPSLKNTEPSNKDSQFLQYESEQITTQNNTSFSGVQNLINLVSVSNKENQGEADYLKSAEEQCRLALQAFHMRSKLLRSFLTPNAAILKFQGDESLTVESVRKKQSEFLSSHRVNIISVKAEPGIISISVARPNRQILTLPEVWKDWKPSCENGNHEILIGVKEEDGKNLFLSPKRHSPHTLIAGATNSGKSVLMQNIILSIACTNTPQQAQIILIDPKQGVDFSSFEQLPHLHEKRIITTTDESLSALSQLIEIMDYRYSILRQNRVPNLFELNKKLTPAEQFPVLWVIHDEFATWMMTNEYKENVSNIVGRLGVQARAAGIFLIFAAQRPDANVMPMQLRDNLGNRLILKVSSEGTSEIALGEKGAERLLGKGHMAAKLEGEEGIIFAQVPFLCTEDLDMILRIPS